MSMPLYYHSKFYGYAFGLLVTNLNTKHNNKLFFIFLAWWQISGTLGHDLH